MDTCNNIIWHGVDDSDIPIPKLLPPTGGEQIASVVITGNSNIVFKDCDIAHGAGTLTVISAGSSARGNIWRRVEPKGVSVRSHEM